MFCSCRISTHKCLARSLCNSRATCGFGFRPKLDGHFRCNFGFGWKSHPAFSVTFSFGQNWNYNLRSVFNYGGSCTDKGEIWYAEDLQSILMCQISSWSVYSVTVWLWNTPNWRHFFGLQHLCCWPLVVTDEQTNKQTNNSFLSEDQINELWIDDRNIKANAFLYSHVPEVFCWLNNSDKSVSTLQSKCTYIVRQTCN